MTVTGRIGNDNVFLENAATESTLREILKAIQSQDGQGIDSEDLEEVLDRSNISEETVERANSALQGLVKVANLTRDAFDGLNSAADFGRKVFDTTFDIFETIRDSAGKSSDVFGLIARQGGIIGLFGAVMEKTAEYAEESLEAFRQLSRSGINFAGDLGLMQRSAASVYLTLDQFTKLLKDNSEAFAKLGEGANRGAIEFVNMSQGFQSQFGSGLRAMGFSFEEVNQGLASYITVVGGLSKKERADKQKLFASTNKYLKELDLIAQITGKSREAIEDEGKAAALQAAVSRKLQSMDATSAGQVTSALRLAAATGIPGLVEAMQARLLGLPETTEQARLLAGFAPEIVQQGYQMIDNARNGIVTNFGSEINSLVGAVNEVTGRMSSAGEDTISTIDALTMLEGPFADVASGVLSFENQVRNAGDIEKLAGELSQEQIDLQKSQAQKAAEVEQAMMEIRKQLINDLTEIGAMAIPLLRQIVTGAQEAVEWFSNTIKGLPGGLISAFGLVVSAALILKGGLFALQAYINKMILQGAIGGAGGGAGGGKGGFGKFAARAAGGLGLGLASMGVGYAGNAVTESLGGTETDAGKASDTLTRTAEGALLGASIGIIGGPIAAAIGAGIGGLAYGGMAAFGNYFQENETAQVSSNEQALKDIQNTQAEMDALNKQALNDYTSMAQQTKMTAVGSLDNKAVNNLLAINNEILSTLRSLNSNVDRAASALRSAGPDLFRG